MDNASLRPGTTEPGDLRYMAEAWGEDIFPTPPEHARAKDAAAADVLRRMAVPHLLACADEIERLRDVATAGEAVARYAPSNAASEVPVDALPIIDLVSALEDWRALLDDRTETT